MPRSVTFFLRNSGRPHMPISLVTMGRIEVLTGVERRRRWSAEEKRRIVAEASAPGVTAAAVARRYDLHPHQIYGWRRRLRSQAHDGFVPVVVAAEPVIASSRSGLIEIALANGWVLRVSEGIVPATLVRLVETLER